ncbi:MAG: hypothetical protein WHV66_11435 [Anaerolineales bacterium]|jgi:hypothetical protein
MNLSGVRKSFSLFGARVRLSPSLLLGLIILTALLAFEMFNYSTTEYALKDLLGDLKFAGIRWATILAIAFCGIDFAGIARLFTPEQGRDEPREVWYLFGAWLLAATMNAMLTWWGVSMAIVSHEVQSTAVIPIKTLTRVVPAFVAIMVWVIRILIIGTISVAGDRILWGATRRSTGTGMHPTIAPAVSSRPAAASSLTGNGLRPSITARPARSTSGGSIESPASTRPEPTYHSLSINARPPSSGSNESPRML